VRMSKTNGEIIKLNDVWVYYARKPVLKKINLLVYNKDFLGIIGPNGGGKTTLLKVILGLVKPARGRISVFNLSPEEGRKYIGYVPQKPLFDPNFPISVFEVVMMGRYRRRGLFRSYTKEDKKVVLRALEKVGMDKYKNEQIGELSGGEQQKVFIARALVSEPKLLLLDEPLANVDERMRKELYELLGELNNQMTIILVSHDIGAVSTYVKKIACLSQTLFYHGKKEIRKEDLERVYQCPIDLIAHGIPHRVLRKHN